MRDVPASMTQAWRSGSFVGDQRAMARVVVSRPQMSLRQFSHPKPGVSPLTPSGLPKISRTGGSGTTQEYASLLWSDKERPKELPNIKSVSWDRSPASDMGTCVVEVWNCDPMPLGSTVAVPDVMRAGSMVYSYGGVTYSSRWGHVKNEWFGWLMPDNIIRTFEGYGFDPNQCPERDEKLVQTGVWKIKYVDMSTDSRVIRLTCEDMSSLLHEQIAFPPVVPRDWYPLRFGPIPDPLQIKTDNITSGARLPIKITKTSNLPWNGDAPMFGHAPGHAVDNNPGTYWLSVGNAHPSRGFAYEYIEFSCGGPSNLDEVRFLTAGSGYIAYLSVSTNNRASWHGSQVIGWQSDGIGRNGGDIMFLQSMQVTSEGEHVFKVAWDNVTHFRITLGNLQHFPMGTYKYRGGFREVSATSGQQISTTTTTVETVPKSAVAGQYAGVALDWSDVIKMCCAWAGFYWPLGASRMLSDGTMLPESPVVADPTLAAPGRIWADVESTGTMGRAGIRSLDKKTLYAIISEVRDIIGYGFWIDETGAPVWRLQNLFSVGNWVTTLNAHPRRTQEIITLDEATTLMSLSARVSSQNVRETIYVGNPLSADGVSSTGVSAQVAGWNPNPTGLRRSAGWMDQGFATNTEAEVMADMLALRGLFSYRKDQVQIPGYPAIQIDDQVRIYERTLSEGYLHYVDGISSNNDLVTGVWTYDLETHWLGDHPDGVWTFDVNKFTPPGNRNVKKGTVQNLMPSDRMDLRTPRAGQ